MNDQLDKRLTHANKLLQIRKKVGGEGLWDEDRQKFINLLLE